MLFFLALPGYRHWSEKRGQLATAQAKVSELENVIATVGNFNEEDYLETLNKIKQALPFDLGEEDLLVTFETAATNNGLLLNSIDISEEKEKKQELINLTGEAGQQVSTPKSKTKKALVQLDLLGSYPSLKRFLQDCETNVRVLNVRNIRFAIPALSGETTQDAEVFKYMIEIETYYLTK